VRRGWGIGQREIQKRASGDGGSPYLVYRGGNVCRRHIRSGKGTAGILMVAFPQGDGAGPGMMADSGIFRKGFLIDMDWEGSVQDNALEGDPCGENRVSLRPVSAVRVQKNRQEKSQHQGRERKGDS